MSLKKSFIPLIFTSAALLPLSSYAESTAYVGAQYARTTIDASVEGLGSVDWKPSNIIFNAGIDFTNNFALEARYGFSVSDDSVGGVELEVDELSGIYAKLSMGQSISPYILLGYSNIGLDTNLGISGSDNDYSYGLGVDFKISENTSINLEYTNYFDEEESGVSTEISTVGIGLIYTLGL